MQGVSLLRSLTPFTCALNITDLQRHEYCLNADLCTPIKGAKNNDRTASVVARACARADHVTRSISYIAKKLVTCLVASLARARKRRHLG